MRTARSQFLSRARSTREEPRQRTVIATDFEVIHVGCIGYVEGVALQRRLVTERRSDARPDTIVLAEHPATYTIGRSGSRGHILIDDAELARLGITVIETDRGGDVTYHGPGQIVAYPIIDLRQRGGDAHAYLRALENGIVHLLAKYGVCAERDDLHTGVWLGHAKIASIGVKISSGITSHGVALNVATDPEHWAGILACGIEGRTVTNLQEHYHGSLDLNLLTERMVTHLRMSFVRTVPRTVA
ncbi:MAG: lipoyl(octanoyl) transferase LipB [Chloroflexota bacterium]|nr:MAG: lipoyl(octanoyl) transferase LipB [Chloroflexota bacterium]